MSNFLSCPTSRSVSALTPSSATVATLLACARSLSEDGLSEAAGNALRAAALTDDSPASKFALAEWLLQTEQLREAAAVYEQLLARAATTNDSELRRVASHNLAAVLRDSGDAARASTLNAVSQRDELAASGQLSASDLTSQALDAAHRGELAFAEELLLRSLVIEQDRNSAQGIATDYGNLGAVAAMRGNLSGAIRYLSRAYRAHLGIQNLRGAGTDLLNLAEIFRTLGRFRLAGRCLVRAEQFFQRSGSGRSVSVTRDRLREIERLRAIRSRDPLLN